uniref:Conotoxin LeDr192 n=2 Tax=Conus TaxID=6490 RepID=CT192_CONLT|nr:RecName: Full=Conotoxin LeDr192; Flags: Precursor [Conus litteratus]Q9BPG6.1 RecName: Full=Epsilon-conotoxin TxVA; AltName: Full=Conotoxin TxMRCL-011; AltName: Full=Epsilon-conotoxin TxIX; Flags: Precursor [Conus textile]AAG60390.1 conotoxin scaffold IX precursor [Conus textile]AAZ85407.1 LeDr192P [Conus litteratus]
MRCFPVFIILLLLIASAPCFDARTKTDDDVPLSPLRDNLKRTIRTRLNIRECCEDGWCCTAAPLTGR